MDPHSRPEVKREFRRVGFLLWFVYFAQKFSNNSEGLSKLPVRKLLQKKKVLGGFELGPAQAAEVQVLAMLGWFVKPFLAMITDRVPVLGYRRRSWLIITNLAGGIAWLTFVLTGASTLTFLVLTLTSVNFCLAFADVICDGLMVEIAQGLEERYGIPEGTANRPLQAMQWVGGIMAITLCSVAGGVIAQFYTLRMAAVISSGVLIALGLSVGFLVREERTRFEWQKAKLGVAAIGIILFLAAYRWITATNPAPNAGEVDFFLKQWMPIVNNAALVGLMVVVARFPLRLLPALLFVILWWIAPYNTDSSAVYRYFTKDHVVFLDTLKSDTTVIPALQELALKLRLVDAKALKESGFADVFYGSIASTCGFLGLLGGLLVFRWRFKETSLVKVFSVCLGGRILVLGIMFCLVKWASMLQPLTVMGTFAMDGFFSGMALLAALSFAAAKCPQDDQATIYATFAASMNIGLYISGEQIGARLYEHFGHAGPGKEPGEIVIAMPHAGMLSMVLVSAAVQVALFVAIYFLGRRKAFEA